jgi:hypothetical protein
VMYLPVTVRTGHHTLIHFLHELVPRVTLATSECDVEFLRVRVAVMEVQTASCCLRTKLAPQSSLEFIKPISKIFLTVLDSFHFSVAIVVVPRLCKTLTALATLCLVSVFCTWLFVEVGKSLILPTNSAFLHTLS